MRSSLICIGMILAQTGYGCGGEAAVQEIQRCNGHAALCDRRFNEVAFAAAHNAMSHADGGWLAPNQDHDIPTQLQDGVRAFLIDIQYNEVEGAAGYGTPYFCHGYCALGGEPAAVTLGYFKTFLDNNPNEVMVFDVQQSISVEDMIAAMDDAGLSAYAAPHTKGERWPTLRQMIAGNRRLVFLTEADPGDTPAPPWYLYIQAHSWDTPYDVQTPDEFVCTPDRGDPGADLMLLNHFLTNPIASRELAETVNFNPFLYDRAAGCRAASGQMPNFVAVDFYATGDLLAAVDRLNGVGGR